MKTPDNKFNAILAKNRLARKIKGLYKGETIPLYIYSDFEEIEKYLGLTNLPLAADIFDSDQDI